MNNTITTKDLQDVSDTVIKMICDDYGISAGEFNSSFKYGSLPEARQLFCLALSSYGLKGKDICSLTGYSPGRVCYTVQAAKKLLQSMPFFRQRHNRLLKIIKTLTNESKYRQSELSNSSTS